MILAAASMVVNTATPVRHVAPPNTNMEIENSNDVSEKNIEIDARDAANKSKKQIVKEDAEPETDEPTPSGGPKAWLYVLATFLMFISAW